MFEWNGVNIMCDINAIMVVVICLMNSPLIGLLSGCLYGYGADDLLNCNPL